MGTRNLTMVIDKEGELKVAQYGQWDGYPEGQGTTILNFCKDKNNLGKLQAELKNIAFIYDNEYLKKWYEEEYCSRCPGWSNQPDLRTKEMEFWWDYLMSRDIGGKILERIISVRDIVSEMFGERNLPKEHNGKIVLYNDVNFGRDSLMCEWAYCVNFKTNKLECYKGFNKDKAREAEMFKATEEELKQQEECFKERKYYGIWLVKEYDLNNLPEKEDFVKELYDLTKEGDEDNE